ncbi:hypothetical protein [Methanococcus voltae]|uniref:Fe2+ or Zn2+ uptake regulation protein n=2 Tax=Methanococcus voltae TaxID=2188 RepID=A0A8J7S063_METVO|nr:hypothetical protein [Methanococcus voltae]MBP2172054.1 Fe2+ or Zn2+ uptake regulation protein [Methanococcus voltae]MBP2200990.1 Fe2+ or Zn2+ uptake regulation protein [Methanococcus voltae]MCS3921713.1 Fe2+ or Zn2+ uptake regulation protein [Methanococcus voltae PS]
MASQEEILDFISDNNGAVTYKTIKNKFSPNYSGSSSLSNRLRQLHKKKMVSKVNGAHGEILYFICDLKFFES